ncbi:MAG: hypothetical protein ACQER1_07595 [Armatimonadota bacterium]
MTTDRRSSGWFGSPALGIGALAVAAVLLLGASAGHAEDPREEAVVTLRSGGLSVEVQRAYSWSIQKISHRGVVVGTPSGAFGMLACVPVAGGWIGSMHTEGGVERVEEVSLIVDGESVEVDDGATYTGERLVLRKRSMLDKLRLEATLTLTDGMLTQHHEVTATEDVVVTVVYPFMFPVSSEASRWMAVSSEGEGLDGDFGVGGALEWHDDWTWTGAFIPDRATGVVVRHLARADGEDVTTLTGWWDQERHRKLYVAWDKVAEPWPEGLTLSGEIALRCFEAPEIGWQEMARQVASELVAE